MGDGKGSSDKMLNYIWKWEVSKINDHLPKRTVSLSELLAKDEPSIETRDGTQLWIDKDELAKVANLVPSRLHVNLHLPIVVIRRIDLGEGVFSISGGKLEMFFTAKMLGLAKEPFDSYGSAEIPTCIYRPQVQELRRKLRTLSIVGFGGVEQEDVDPF